MYTLEYMIRVAMWKYPTPESFYEFFKSEFPGMRLEDVKATWPKSN